MIRFTIHGNPRPQQRHRHATANGVSRTYDPSAQEKNQFALQARIHKPREPITGPIVMYATFYIKRPKSHYKKSGEVKDKAPVYHTQKPDTDNFIKFVKDALEGSFYKNDSQIFEEHSTKKWAEEGATVIDIIKVGE